MTKSPAKRRAIYAGTFDPVTFGHLDVAARAALRFDELVVAVAEDTRKNCLFTTAERCELAAFALRHIPNIRVTSFRGLLVEWAKAQGVPTLIRGLRAFSDFEYEFQMALANRKLEPAVETLFLMPSADFSYVSSSMVKEIASLGGEIARFVPPHVEQALRAKFAAPPARKSASRAAKGRP